MFENILGQELAKKRLSNLVKNKRISNAYIFTGPEGVGKKLMAKEFANCLIGMNVDNSSDFILIEPKKGENTIKIEQIRELNSSISLKPYSNYKIYLINDSEKMTIQAQNALLKTLEEPCSYGIIILVTKNEQALLETIRSRCIEVKFSSLSMENIKKILKSNGVSSNDANVATIFARGSASMALSISQNSEIISLRNGIEDYLSDVLLKKDKFKASVAAEFFKKDSDNISGIIQLFKIYIRDAIIMRDTYGTNMLINKDKENLIRRLASALSLSQLGEILSILNDTDNKLNANCNFNSTIQAMSLNIYKVVNRW
ncbi:ATP-binding protein [Peptostreptococcus canis]|uniref:DNA polymerase III subunit delta' n=1 Tax=Peptostreptococcus canis TaxID=1159213 RepID=A0ABR6TM27_9FIRM|nr:DNA polymerase III subunit delta' C-terminal domain-containing protein [Peptostreptococcus canis]MBC2576370.1 AAA family ATPase [Peptostreptococcus canis]MBP1998569.1 DNA polymerase-3 subunit delta' [Peptostreptococcus canis]